MDVTIDLEHLDVVSHPMAHNEIAVVRSITVVPRGDADSPAVSAATVDVSITDSDGALTEPCEITVDLAPGQPVTITDPPLRLDVGQLDQVREQRPATLLVRIRAGETILGEVRRPVRVLAAQQWLAVPPGLADELLASFVMPNAPEITALMHRTADRLQAATGNDALNGYQAGAQRVDAMVEAIFDELRAGGIRYAEPPASWADVGQKIRTPAEVIDGHIGTCLDTTVVMAAALEQAGIRPLIWLTPTHAFLAYWREELSASAVATPDPTSFLNRLDLGLLGVVETTALTRETTFAEAQRAASTTAHSSAETATLDGPGVTVVDVWCARRARIVPLPAVRRTPQGTVETIVYQPAVHSTAPADHVPDEPAPEPGRSDRPPTPRRVRQWKNSLLDLSLRNSLINHSRRSGLPLILPGELLPRIEDDLHNGRAINLLPTDQIDAVQVARLGAASARALPADALTVAYDDRRAIHVDVTSDAYPRRLQNLAHRARTIQDETGANNLYLALGWLRWSLDGRDLRSPLILVPVTLNAGRTHRTTYRLKLDETGVSTPNFCLLEKLRVEFGLKVPELVEPATDGAGIDLRAAFTALRIAIETEGLDWQVEEAAELAVLMFGRFRQWKDLDEHWPELVKQPLVSHLVHSPTEDFRAPDAPRPAPSLEELANACPIPGDASQLAAVSALIGGRTLVLEGPPGTGKSQTIANVLARYIADGRSVLFVAEKRAALDVVADRIADVGLSAFTLDLHDAKSRPTGVRRQILAALDARAEADVAELATQQQITASASGTLARYRDAVHTPNSGGFSLYDAATRASSLGDGPMLTVDSALFDRVDDEQVNRLRTMLQRLPETAAPARPAPRAPWSFVDTDAADTIDVDAVVAAARRVDAALTALSADAELATVVHAAPTVADLRALARWAEEPPVWRDEVQAAAKQDWQQTADSIIADLTDAAGRAERFGVQETFFELPVGDLVHDLLEATRSSWFGRKRRMRKAAAAFDPGLAEPLVVDDRESLAERARELGALAEQFADVHERIRMLPGVGPAPSGVPDEAMVADVAAQVDRLRLLARHLHEPANAAFGTAVEALWHRPGPDADASVLHDLASALDDVFDATGATAGLDTWRGEQGVVGAWAASGTKRSAETGPVTLRRWLAFRDMLAPLRSAGLTAAYRELLTGAVPAAEARLAFERGMVAASMAERRDEAGLHDFDPAVHDGHVQRFTTALQQVQRLQRSALAHEACTRRSFDASANAGRIGELRRALMRQRGGLSVREMMQRYAPLIAEVTPCMLVSPDSLARFVPVGSFTFDLVVFDEASQITVAGAIGALGRARAAAIVGDSQQMPPTAFAEAVWRPDDDEELEDDQVVVDDEESILSECVQAGVERHWLSWHYRSRHESLIAFSNANYYEGRLSSFPSPSVTDRDPGPDGHGINFVRVAGHFERENRGREYRTNRVEAEAVVAEVQRRFTAAESASASSSIGPPSIGIVTFNQPQRTLIESLLRELDDPGITAALDDHTGQGLFIKNLENVQGDERDVILFSVAFSKNRRGVLPLNFGPLNQAGGERRLNVAITRARRQVVLFCSFDPGDLRAEATSSVGVKHLRSYLELAERGTTTLQSDQGYQRVVDRHRDDIAERLRARGCGVRVDVGLSDFRVDLVVSPVPEPFEPTMAVMLDGPAWARRRTVGDRDGMPGVVLRLMLGWPVVARVWLPAWLDDADAVVDDLLDRLANPAPEPEPAPAPQDAPPPPVADADDPTDSGTGDASDPAPELPRFTPWAPDHEHDVRFLDRAAKDADIAAGVRGLIEDLLRTEGPTSQDRVAKSIATSCGLSRVTASRRADILRHAPEPDEHGFCWPADLHPDRWTGYRPDPDQQRDIEEISPHEIANAMVEIGHRTRGISTDELLGETVALFGFARRTERVTLHVETGLALALSSGRLQRQGSYLHAT